MTKILRISLAAVSISALFYLSSCTKSELAPYTFADMNCCLLASSLGQHYQAFTFQINHNDLITTVNKAGAKDMSRVLGISLSQMKAVAATGSNFDQIGNIEVYFKTTNTPQDSVQIAFSGPFNTGDTQNTLQMSGVDISSAVSYDPIITVKILNKNNGNNAICIKLTQGIATIKIRE